MLSNEELLKFKVELIKYKNKKYISLVYNGMHFIYRNTISRNQKWYCLEAGHVNKEFWPMLNNAFQTIADNLKEPLKV